MTLRSFYIVKMSSGSKDLCAAKILIDLSKSGEDINKKKRKQPNEKTIEDDFLKVASIVSENWNDSKVVPFCWDLSTDRIRKKKKSYSFRKI